MSAKGRSGYGYVRKFLQKGAVLDVGCAVGEELETFPEGSFGLDGAAEFVKIAADKGLRVAQADFNQTLPVDDSSFETIFCSHVMEHVEAPYRLLRDFRRILREGGHVVLGLPLESDLMDWRRKYFDGHPYHLYAFTPRNARHLLKMTGYEPVGVWYDFPRKLSFATGILNAMTPLTTPLAPGYWIVGKKTAAAEANLRQYSNEALVEAWERFGRT